MPAVAELECRSESNDESQMEKGQDQSSSFVAQAQHIPHRMQQVLINWVFIVASAALMLDFGALQDLMQDPAHPDSFAEMCNWFGVVSCIGWFTGFLLLTHWLHQVGATSMGLLGAYLKLIASIFFNLQPMTGTMNDPFLGGGGGVWWSNMTGIMFFHIGNLVSCLDFYLHTPPGADKKKGWCFHGNLPVTAMWVYQAATWFLVASNAFATAAPGSQSLFAITSPPVAICQMTGGGLLLVGSLIYTAWCDGFTNFSY